ncbi:MAG: transcription antitermination protein NusB [Alloprevotella sp.]
MINRELIRLKVVQLVYAFHQNGDKTFDVADKELSFSLDKAYDLYKYLLTLLVEMKRFAERKENTRIARESRMPGGVRVSSNDKPMAENKFLNQLEQNKYLVEYIEKSKKPWPDEESLVKNLYKQFTDSDVYQLYLTKGEFDYEADREVIRKLYKTIVCTTDLLDSSIEEASLYWNDDKTIVDSFVLKTIKRFDPANGSDQTLLPDYASDDDRVFAHALFKAALEYRDKTYECVAQTSRNWDVTRVATMDLVIMQTALAEIMTFPSIPLSVSFNEYLDIAKIYSTPRSASFINGLLDRIVRRLVDAGELLKR